MSESFSGDDEEEVDENGNVIRNEDLQLDDEIDDTQLEVPDGYVIGENIYHDDEPEEILVEVPKPIIQKEETEVQEFDWGF